MKDLSADNSSERQNLIGSEEVPYCDDDIVNSPISKTMFFHEIFPVDYVLPANLDDWDGEDDIPDLTNKSKGKLGLPMALIDEKLAGLKARRLIEIEIENSKSSKIRASVARDGMVLPGFYTTNKKPPRLVMISANEHQSIQKDGSLKKNGEELQFSTKSKENLTNRGIAYASQLKGKERVVAILSPAIKKTATVFYNRAFQRISMDKEYGQYAYSTPINVSSTEDIYPQVLIVYLADKRADLSNTGGSNWHINGLHNLTILNSATTGNMTDDQFYSAFAIQRAHPKFLLYYHQFKKAAQIAPAQALPEYRIGILTRFTQKWTLKEYSQGPFLNCIALYPQESRTIEIVEWEKQKVERSRDFQSEYNNSVVNESTNSRTSEITYELANSLSTSLDSHVSLLS